MTDRVVSEPRVYSPDSPHSFHLDRATQAGMEGFEGAAERLQRHGVEVLAEIAEGSDEGRRASRAMAQAESRAMSASLSASGASFVTPQYLTELFPTYRSADRTFVNQCRPVPMPAVGLTLHVPSFASAAFAGQQLDNAGVGEVDPTGADLPVTVVQIPGEVTISQQMFDRGGSQGASIDIIVQAQINSQLDAAIDAYAINQAIASAATVTDAATLTITNLFQDLSLAREKLTDTAGTRLAGTHLFTTSDLSGWITKQVDSQQRPIFLPDAGALLAVDDDPTWAGFLGLALPGGLRWFADDNIPVSGSNTQLLVSRPQEILFWEGDPFTSAYPTTSAAGNLSVVVGLRKYVAVLPRYAKATAVIGGAAFPTSLV